MQKCILKWLVSESVSERIRTFQLPLFYKHNPILGEEKGWNINTFMLYIIIVKGRIFNIFLDSSGFTSIDEISVQC